MTRITYLVMDDLVPSDFFTYHTSDAILRHISVLADSIDLHDHPHLRDTCRVADLLLFYDDSLVELITTQKVLFYTFNSLCFKHFCVVVLHLYPNWHVKDLTMTSNHICG